MSSPGCLNGANNTCTNPGLKTASVLSLIKPFLLAANFKISWRLTKMKNDVQRKQFAEKYSMVDIIKLTEVYQLHCNP